MYNGRRPITRPTCKYLIEAERANRDIHDDFNLK